MRRGRGLVGLALALLVGAWGAGEAAGLGAAGTPGPDCAPAAVSIPLVSPTVLGNGSPGSVTAADIQAALDVGGHITFDVGGAPTEIVLTSELVVTRETVLDGAGVVTLSAGGSHRVLRIENPQNAIYTLRLQRIGIANGSTPTASGAAVFKPSGGPWQAVSLIAVDCEFRDNVAIAVEQDGGGGAIYAIGMDEVVIQDCYFSGNRGSNGGAVYSLGSRSVTIVDSAFVDNSATGTGGNPGNGGNAGAVGVDGAERQVAFCGVRLVGNRSNAHGAGFFSVTYDEQSSTTFNACVFDDNVSTGGVLAGGAYLQGGPFAIHNSTFYANEAAGGGAAFLGPGAHGEIVNSTLHRNVASTGLGGALFVSGDVELLLSHVTVTENSAPAPGGFAGGIQVEAVNQVTMASSLLVGNTGGNAFNPWNIRNPVGDGGGNLQWPMLRPNGQPETAATATVTWADPLLLPLDLSATPTPIRRLGPGSPAIDAGTVAGAPSLDQRGVPRIPPPDAGAVEDSGDILLRDGFESGTTSAWSVAVP